MPRWAARSARSSRPPSTTRPQPRPSPRTTSPRRSSAAAVGPRIGVPEAELVGAIGCGIGFVFIVVGRSELFTENFLVPITGLTRDRGTWVKLVELWVVSLAFNLAGGALIAIVLTSHGVLKQGTSDAILRLANHVAHYSPGTSFVSGLAAGALMTLMTWFVEGA